MTKEEILAQGLSGLGCCSHASTEDIERVEKNTLGLSDGDRFEYRKQQEVKV